MALAFVAGWLAVAGHMSVLLRLSAFVYVRARGPIEFQLRPKSETSELRPIHDRTPGISVRPCQRSGGCGIRTREGLHPTRFPSERHRPLGESSARNLTGNAQPRRTPSVTGVTVLSLCREGGVSGWMRP